MLEMKKLLRTLAFILITVFVVSYPVKVSADSETSADQKTSIIGVSPAIIESVLTPDTLAKTKIQIFNNSRFPIPMKAFARSFIATEDLSHADSDKFDSSSWITLNPADFILQPGEHKEIEVMILPDKHAEPGGHYATIYFQPLVPESVLSSDSTFLSSRVGVLAFFVVKGDIKENAEISNVKYPRFVYKNPINFDIVLKNTGNVHILPVGELKLKNILTGAIDSVEIKPNVVLPETEKTSEYLVSPKMPFGIYDASIFLQYGSDRRILNYDVKTIVAIPVIHISTFIIILTVGFYFFIVKRARLFVAFHVLFGKDLKHDVNTDQKPKKSKQKPAK